MAKKLKKINYRNEINQKEVEKLKIKLKQAKEELRLIEEAKESKKLK